MRGGLWSSFSVPAAGIFTYFEVYSCAGHRPYPSGELIGSGWGRKHAAAGKPRLELLIRGDNRCIHDRVRPVRSIGAISPPAHGTGPATRPLS